MQLIIKKAGYWESLTVFLQDGRIPNIANHGITMELEPAIWFKVLFSSVTRAYTVCLSDTMGTRYNPADWIHKLMDA